MSIDPYFPNTDLVTRPANSRENQLRMPQGGQRHIAIWGAPQSGKTVYLAMLYDALVHHRIPDLDHWNIYAEPDANEWISAIQNKLTIDGIFPPATQEGAHYFPSFKIRDGVGNELFAFTFIDAPGEMYANTVEYTARYNLNPDPFSYLAACSGILLLLDPTEALEGNFPISMRALMETLQKLSQARGGGKIPIPVALCITKCDDTRCRRAFPTPEQPDAAYQFAEEIFFPLNGTLQTFFPDGYWQWFACSAIGFEKDASANIMRRWNGQWGILDRQKLNPMNIVQPLEWLSKHFLQSGTERP
jgi:hypothetical protein